MRRVSRNDSVNAFKSLHILLIRIHDHRGFAATHKEATLPVIEYYGQLGKIAKVFA
jgi:hypothetical protein